MGPKTGPLRPQIFTQSLPSVLRRILRDCTLQHQFTRVSQLYRNIFARRSHLKRYRPRPTEHRESSIGARISCV